LGELLRGARRPSGAGPAAHARRRDAREPRRRPRVRDLAEALRRRSGRRRPERGAGAGRGRGIRQLLAERVLLAVLRGALGSRFAVWGVQAMAAFLAENRSRPFGFEIAVEGRVLVFTLALSLVVGIVFGLAPALRATRVDLADSLRGETVAGGRARVGN